METMTMQTDFRLEAESPDRHRRDCPHPGTPHRHGTRVSYVTDRCRCIACRAANRAEERERTAAVRSGCWQPFVDAQPARTHLNVLRQQGVGLDQIVKITQTPKATVRRVLGQSATAAQRIRAETADRLLAINISAEHVAPRSQVDATETHFRIQSLIEAGHSIPELARAMGKSSVSLRRTLSRRSVTAQTAALVSVLYGRLQGENIQQIPGVAVPRGDIRHATR